MKTIQQLIFIVTLGFCSLSYANAQENLTPLLAEGDQTVQSQQTCLGQTVTLFRRELGFGDYKHPVSSR